MSPSVAVSSDTSRRTPNPFASSVFGNALDQNPIDVAEINAAAFNICCALIDEVRERRFTQALVLMGEPGSGKTHLLSRLRSNLEKEALAGKPSLFIPIRMLANSRMLWRFLRRHLAVALLRQRAFTRVISRSVDEIAEHDRNLAIILGNLTAGVHFADSAAWLRGDELPEEVLNTLKLSSSGDEVEQEAASSRFVTTLCAMGEPGPFVFCFDQFEGLQSYRDDKDGYFKMGQIISDLHDSTHNVALIPCLQTSVLPEFEEAIRHADRDRLRRRAALLPLTLEQAMKLVNARLDSVPELQGQRPIRENDIKALFHPDGLCVARRVIVHCHELFNRWLQTPAVPVEPLEVELEKKYRNLQRTPRVEDAEGILRVALPSMLYLRGIKLSLPSRPDTVLDGVVAGNTPAATAICNQRPGLPLLKRLDKARADWRASGAPMLLILRDARNGIGAGALKTREAVDKLEKEGARILHVKPEALSALEAISRLLANARSGDLTYRGDSIPVSTVETWLSGNMPVAVDELLDEMGGDREAASHELTGMLIDLLAKAKVISVEDAASQLAKTTEEVEECARRNAALVGFAGGSKRVLFRMVERSSEELRD
jgi:hypothetical protein